MFDLNTLALDLDATENGVRMDLGNGAYVVIARWGNKKQAEILNKKMKGLRRRIGQRDPTEDEAMEVMVDVIADSIVLDWDGISIGNERIPYSKDNVRRVWKDKRLERFQQLIMDFSKDSERYYEQSIEDDLGNLQNGSNGKPSTEAN